MVACPWWIDFGAILPNNVGVSSLFSMSSGNLLRQVALWLLVVAQTGAVWAAADDYEEVRQRLLRQLNSLSNSTPVSVTAPAPAASAPVSPAVTAPVAPSPATVTPTPVSALAAPTAPASTLTLAAAAPVTPTGDLPEAMKLLDDKRVLSAGDRVSFRVLEDREDPKQLLVTDSGELEVPYVGRVKAAEKTCLALARELKVLLEKDYYHRATVVLAVDALAKSRGKVYLYGQVRSAGAFEIPVDETLTVSKVILRAGGFSDFANKKKVTITRKVPGGRSENFELDLVDILEKGRSENDREVQDGDMIFVPQRLINF
jgi:protein involved in polysaccharide export with SLBB domain